VQAECSGSANTTKALSDLIVKHYMAAGHIKSAESVLGDLAALRLYVSNSPSSLHP
jgi:hypothetical protein